MNTESKKTFRRFFICILFWTIIFCLGFLLAPHSIVRRSGMNTGSGSGNGAGQGQGSGSGQQKDGRGTGQGQGSGSGERKEAKNTGRKGNAETAASAAPQKAAARPAKAASATPAPSLTENPKSQLKILSTDAASEDVATIYRAGKSSDSSTPAGTSAGFFGVKITGSSLFLLDVSGSMDSSSKEGNTRLDLVKREMEKTLKSMFKDAEKNNSRDRFRIVCFSDGCTFFPEQGRGSYRFSSSKQIVDSINFVKQLSAFGGTCMKRAWELIIPILKEDKIKSVYFLSDGAPTDCTTPVLLTYLKAAVPDLTIHTISMGESSELLRQIAEQHGGQYKEVY